MVNGLLLVCLLFQIWLAWQIVTEKKIILPDIVLRQIQEELQPWELELSWTRASVNLEGRVLCEGLVLRHTQFDDPLVTARALEVDCNWLGLIFGLGQPVQQLRLDGGTVGVPAAYSRSGAAEIVFGDLALDIQLFRDRFAIRRFQVTSGEHFIVGSGSWTGSVSDVLQEIFQAEVDNQPAWVGPRQPWPQALLPRLASVPRYLEPLRQGWAKFTLDEDPETRSNRVALKMGCESMSLGEDIQLENTLLEIHPCVIQVGMRPRLDLHVAKISGSSLDVRNVSLRGLSPQKQAGAVSWRNRWELTSGPGVWKGERWEALACEVAPGSLRQSQAQAQWVWRGHTLRARVVGDLGQGSLRAQILGEMDLPGLLSQPPPAVRPIAAILQCEAPLTLEATLVSSLAGNGRVPGCAFWGNGLPSTRAALIWLRPGRT